VGRAPVLMAKPAVVYVAAPAEGQSAGVAAALGPPPVVFTAPGSNKIDSVGMPEAPLPRESSTIRWNARTLLVVAEPATQPSAAPGEAVAALRLYTCLLLHLLLTLLMQAEGVARGDICTPGAGACPNVLAAGAGAGFGPRLTRTLDEAVGSPLTAERWAPVTTGYYWPAASFNGVVGGGVSVDTDARAHAGAVRGVIGAPSEEWTPHADVVASAVAGTLGLLAFGLLATCARPMGVRRAALWAATLSSAPALERLPGLRWLQGASSRTVEGTVPLGQHVTARAAGSERPTVFVCPSFGTAFLILRALALPCFVPALLLHALISITGYFPSAAPSAAGNAPTFFFALFRAVIDLVTAWAAHRLIKAAGPSWVIASGRVYC
jgi:hypothetical protein